ncbi:MAG: ATP-dependent DNA ligase [Frankiaceae bacterium]
MPAPYVPALARDVGALPAAGALPGGCAYEPKYDGWRVAVIVPAGGPPRLVSRHGRRLDAAFPEIAADALRLPAGTVVDGELIAWRDGALDFPALARRAASRGGQPGVGCAVAAFDLLELAGADLRPLPYDERRRRLTDLLDPTGRGGGLVSAVPMTTDPATAAEWFDALVRLGVEGLVVKGRAEPYRAGARCWLKVKHRTTRELVVGATTGPPRAPVLVLGAVAGARLRVVGRTTVLGAATAAAVWPRLSPAGAGHPWPAELPARALGAFARGGAPGPVPIRRVVPDLTVEVVADTACDHGRYRHALRLLRVRDDP